MSSRRVTRDSGFWVRLFRILRLSAHLAAGLATVTFLFPLLSRDERSRRVRRWSKRLIGLLGVQLTVRGRAPTVRGRGVMLVANHISWLDVFLLNAVCPAHFISKSEVKRWPVAGQLVRRAGTLFIERQRRSDLAQVNRQVAELLREGDCVAFFPEGTTTDGTRLKPFRAPLLQPVSETGAWLWPVAIRYLHPDGQPDLRPAYFDNMSFRASLWRILKSGRIHADLTFLQPVDGASTDRRSLVLRAQSEIAASLGVAAEGRRPETHADLQDAG
jgi:1-acyl-sn-glycerol-3-phosphate acyltransferase